MSERRESRRPAGRSRQKAPILDTLRPDEARAVLKRLLDAHPDLAAEAEGIAKNLLGDVSFEEVAAEVEDAIRGIEDDDVYGRSGRHEWGYVDPGDAAVGLLEEAVEPFVSDMRRRFEQGMDDQALAVCQGILLGLYRVRGAKEQAVIGEASDFPAEQAGVVRNIWSSGGRGEGFGRRVEWGVRDVPREFVLAHLPEWDWLLPEGERRPKAGGRASGRRRSKR